jgi:GDP-4-dehydro-6-deoxy-D-mannose reductase
VPTGEGAPLAPSTHYAMSKVMAEGLCRTFAAVDSVRCVAARPFNVLGPGEPPGSVTSRIVEQFEHGTAGGSTVDVKLRESVSVRDLVDVVDVASALLVLAAHGEAGAAYNVCGGRGVTIQDLVVAVAEAQGSAYTLEVEDPQAAGTVSIGSPVALAALGWSPRYDLAGSLRKILTSRRHRDA